MNNIYQQFKSTFIKLSLIVLLNTLSFPSLALAQSVFSLDTLKAGQGFILHSDSARGYAGNSVTVGDINGDNIDDLIVVAYVLEVEKRATYVVFGSESGFNLNVQYSELDGTNGFKINAAGRGITTGDINGDGIDDIIGISPSFVLFGKRDSFEAEFNLEELNGENGFTLTDFYTNISRPTSVSSGDVNGDGVKDIIIGSPNPSDEFTGTYGQVFIIFGKDSAFDSEFSRNSLDGENGFTIKAPEYYLWEHFGQFVTNGDINDDQIDDIVIGTDKTFILFGRQSGFESEFQLPALDGENGFVFGSSKAYSLYMEDINGDSVDDLIIGEPWISVNNVFLSGRVSVIYGSEGGFQELITIDDIDGENGFYINGSDSNELLGIVSAGDINDDGKKDLIVSAGSTYILFNNDKPKAENMLSDFDQNELLEIVGFSPGFSIASGDINNDGADDVIIDTFENKGNTYVVYGSEQLIDSSIRNANLPSDFILNNNFPNPFNPTTKITFELPRSAETQLTVYDSVGRKVTTLVDKNLNAGAHSYNFNAEFLTSGLYVYSLKIDGEVVSTKKMTLIK
ncbi:MAG: FG-GAP repeat protein [Gracilimonas sp.]|uniref:T9SS type A sorting domain-containing protein n=1 Tax=Gracilimonas TaxID=649462 RepID=UPI001B2E0651|nr:T9SS type A sorting domain-containing protein [Gracilimonas sp.]MBO6584472.1 FG-GAP repeat protein [Gracilimonas sp.]MBO6616257.1 FG-GAP repeat protein [Gracilimonas sp.]